MLPFIWVINFQFRFSHDLVDGVSRSSSTVTIATSLCLSTAAPGVGLTRCAPHELRIVPTISRTFSLILDSVGRHLYQILAITCRLLTMLRRWISLFSACCFLLRFLCVARLTTKHTVGILKATDVLMGARAQRRLKHDVYRIPTGVV